MRLSITDKGRACILTADEKNVIKAFAMGHQRKHISELMRISINTVDWHRGNIRRKTGYTTAIELCRFAIRIGLIEP